MFSACPFQPLEFMLNAFAWMRPRTVRFTSPARSRVRGHQRNRRRAVKICDFGLGNS